MARLLIAIASLLAMTASFAAVSFLTSDPPEAAGPPAVAPGPVRVGPPAGPSEAAEAAKPFRRAPGEDPESFLQAVARLAEEREQAIRDAIMALPDSDEITIDGKLDLYRQALRDAFEGTPEHQILEYRAVLTEVFLRMDSVQRELAALGPNARRRELHHIRREMGYTEEEAARMEEIDERRELRWRNGLAYMEERRRIAATFEGEVLEEELRYLREQYFAHEAKTIELEEGDGFFRYERPRIYGRN